MRLFAAIIVLMAGLFVVSKPGAAHGEPGHSHAEHSRHHADEPEAPSDTGERDEHRLEQQSHDPAGHSHPVGEDTQHQKSSHFVGVDFAHGDQANVLKLPVMSVGRHLVANQRVSGVFVRPPIRPPLG